MKQCISYPEIAIIVCALLAHRYPKSRKEIAEPFIIGSSFSLPVHASYLFFLG